MCSGQPSYGHVGVFKESISILLDNCAQHRDINCCLQADLCALALLNMLNDLAEATKASDGKKRPVRACTSTCQMLKGLGQPAIQAMGTPVGLSLAAPLP